MPSLSLKTTIRLCLAVLLLYTVLRVFALLGVESLRFLPSIDFHFPCLTMDRCVIDRINARLGRPISSDACNALEPNEILHVDALRGVWSNDEKASLLLSPEKLASWWHTVETHSYARLCLQSRLDDLYNHTLEPSHPLSRLIASDETSVKSAFGSCAVVGNSYKLDGSRLGDTIDAHDAVFRINWAPTSEEFRDDVGVRSTVMVLNRNNRYCARRSSRSCHAQFPRDTIVFSKLHTCLDMMRTLLVPLRQSQVYVLSPQWLGLLQTVVSEKAAAIGAGGGKHREAPVASTGFVAAMSAVVLCTNVTLFGFGGDGRLVHNYWTPPRLRSGPKFAHSFSVELDLFRELSDGVVPRALRSVRVARVREYQLPEWRPRGVPGTAGGPCLSPDNSLACLRSTNASMPLRCYLGLVCVDTRAEDDRGSSSRAAYSLFRGEPVPILVANEDNTASVAKYGTVRDGGVQLMSPGDGCPNANESFPLLNVIDEYLNDKV